MAATTTPPIVEAQPAAAAVAPLKLEGAPPRASPRVPLGELTSSVSAVLLLVLLFGAKWYGVAGVPDPSAARPAISTAESGWEGLTLVRWVVLATAVVALASVVLHASQRRHGTQTDTSRLIAGLGALTSLLLVYRVLIALPSADKVIDQKLGAFLGLLCAIGIALGGYASIAEHRARAQTVLQRPRRRRGLAAGRGSAGPNGDDAGGWRRDDANLNVARPVTDQGRAQ